jgi:hypothetical protein
LFDDVGRRLDAFEKVGLRHEPEGSRHIRSGATDDDHGGQGGQRVGHGDEPVKVLDADHHGGDIRDV